MQLFLIGSSGTGKDTQAKLISEYFNLHWMSVGDVLRKRSLDNDKTGLYIKSIIDTGELLDWDNLKPIIDNQLARRPYDFIWTGFPRIVEQAEYFDELVSNSRYKLDFVINLTLSEEIIQKRIEYRKNTDTNVREDDKDTELIKKRMNWYKENIDMIRNYYSKTNRFIDIDASADIPTVFESIKKFIEENLKK